MDYGFRAQDTRTGRFISIDPLTKKYPELTPYQFGSNTPIQAVDLDGKEAAAVNGQINWSYVWGSIGVRGNDKAASVDYVNNVIIPAAEHAAKEAGEFLLLATPGMEEEGLELEASEIFAADATRVEKPFNLPEPKTEAPGATQVKTSTASQTENAVSTAAEPKPKLSKVTKSTKTETLGNGKYTKKTKTIPGRDPGQSRSEMEFTTNKDGKVIRSRKSSYDRANKYQGKKPARGGPEGRKPDGSMPGDLPAHN